MLPMMVNSITSVLKVAEATMVAIAGEALVVFVVLFPDILSLRLARSAWVAIKRSTRFHVNFLINVSSLIKKNKSLGIEESNYPLNKGINYCRFANELFTSCANKYILDEEPGLKITQSPHLKKKMLIKFCKNLKIKTISSESTTKSVSLNGYLQI